MITRSLIVAASLGLLAVVVWVAGAFPANQWDFRTYHAAAASPAGTNPYVTAPSYPGEAEIRPGYVYPPHTLIYFKGFAALNYQTAAWVYLALKCAVLVGLVLLWRAAFLRNEFNVWFLPFALLAFNGATCADLVSGNVQMFELLLVWLAFACYVRGWDVLFGLVLFAAASLRILPILFLGLYLVAGRGRWVYAAALGFVFVAVLLAARRASPELFRSFLQAVIAVRDDGWNSPALWPLIQGVRGYVSLLIGGKGVPNSVAIGVYVAVVATVAVLSIVVGRRIAARVSDERTARLLQVFLACFAYVIVVPHLRPSGYMLLLVPTFYLLRHAPPLHAGIALGVLAIIPANPATGLPYLAPLGVIVTEYYLWLAAVLFWGLFCCQYWNGLDARPRVVSPAPEPPREPNPPPAAPQATSPPAPEPRKGNPPPAASSRGSKSLDDRLGLNG